MQNMKAELRKRGVEATLTRRAVVHGAAWSIPVIAAAVAVPLAAASTTPIQTRSRLRFTNVTATVGKQANTIYANTRVQVTDGPDAVQNLVLVATISRDGLAVTEPFPYTAGWGATPKTEIEWPSVPKGEPVTVTFYASADGCEPITATATVETPGWWA